MRKFTHLEALDHSRRRRSKAPLVLLFALILIATPPMFEFGKMHLARWGLFGLTAPADTPLLDFLSRLPRWEYPSRRAPRLVDPAACRSPVRSKMVSPFAFFLDRRWPR